MRIRWKSGVAYRLMRLVLCPKSYFCVVSPLKTRLRDVFRRYIAAPALTACMFAVAGCAQKPGGKSFSKEYFPSSVYGSASPRVVADGAPVPRGGGRYLVGRPYRVAGRTYVPHEVTRNTSQTGKASWYGSAFHGRRTANGEVYDMRSVTAAHPTWPLPSYARVTNRRNGRSIIVRVNDRGPFHAGRVMDVSSRVADALDFKRFGTADVKIDYVGKAGLAGSDDQILMASLRLDGHPATLDGTPDGRPTMIAEAAPPPPQPAIAPETTVVAAATPTRPQPVAVAMRLPSPLPASYSSPSAVQVASAGEPEQVTSFAPTNPFPVNVPLPPIRPSSLGFMPGGRRIR